MVKACRAKENYICEKQALIERQHQETCQGGNVDVCSPGLGCSPNVMNINKCLCQPFDLAFFDDATGRCRKLSDLELSPVVMSDTTAIDIKWDMTSLKGQDTTLTIGIEIDPDNCLGIKQSYKRGGYDQVDFFLLHPGVTYHVTISVMIQMVFDQNRNIDYPQREIDIQLPTVYTKPAPPGEVNVNTSFITADSTVLKFAPSKGCVHFYQMTIKGQGSRTTDSGNILQIAFPVLSFDYRYEYHLRAYNIDGIGSDLTFGSFVLHDKGENNEEDDNKDEDSEEEGGGDSGGNDKEDTTQTTIDGSDGETPESKTIDAGILAGIISGSVLVLLSVVIIAVILCCRRKAKQTNKAADIPEMGSQEMSEMIPKTSASSLGLNFEMLELLRVKGLLDVLIDGASLKVAGDLGKGNFGYVKKGRLARSKSEKIDVAVKSFHGESISREQLKDLLQEASIMSKLRNPHVLQLLGVCVQAGKPLLVLPFMAHGDLRTYLSSSKKLTPSEDLIKFSTDIAKGMEYLAKNKCVHRDLAARNCMLDENFEVHVADFGLTRDIYEKGYYKIHSKINLPIKWMAMESLERMQFTSKSDVWSFGVVLWEVWCRCRLVPYPGVSNHELLRLLKAGHRLHHPKPDYDCPDRVYDIMRTCWQSKQEDRPTFSYLVQQFSQLSDDKNPHLADSDVITTDGQLVCSTVPLPLDVVKDTLIDRRASIHL